MTKKTERIICIIIGVLFILSLIGTIKTLSFLPSCLYLLALEIFAQAYFQKDKKSNREKKIIFFGIGVVLIIFATFYTIINTI